MHLRECVRVLQACCCGGTASGSVRNSSIEDDSSACAHPISGVPRLLLGDVAQIQNGGWRLHLTRLGIGTRQVLRRAVLGCGMRAMRSVLRPKRAFPLLPRPPPALFDCRFLDLTNYRRRKGTRSDRANDLAAFPAGSLPLSTPLGRIVVMKPKVGMAVCRG